MSWHSDRQSSLDLAKPSGPGVDWHWLRQSETDLKKSGSFRVPFGLSDFLAVSPGGMGFFPEMYFVPGGLESDAATTAAGAPPATTNPPTRPMFMAAAFRNRRRVSTCTDREVSVSASASATSEEDEEDDSVQTKSLSFGDPLKRNVVSWEWLENKMRENNWRWGDQAAIDDA